MFIRLAHRLRLTTRGRTATLASVIGVVLIVAIGATAVLTTHKAKAALPLPATVSDSHSQINTLGVFAPPVGINEAAWDSHMTDNGFTSQLSNAGVGIMRYPGGSTADNFQWYNQSVTYHADSGVPGSGDLGPNDCSNCGVNFDQFMNVAQAAGAQPMITVNYGTPMMGSFHVANAYGQDEAAAWVAYANTNDNMGPLGQATFNAFAPTYTGASPTGHAYGIKYWEIGNEVYGNGTFGTGGSDWEADDHSNPGGRSLGARTYASWIRTYSTVMKDVDPSINIGVVLTAPSNWPDGVVNSTYEPHPWNDTVLSYPGVCSSIDFVDVHWYPQQPGSETDAGLLGAPQSGTNTTLPVTDFNGGVPGVASRIRNLLSKYCPAQGNIQIMVTETNSVAYNPGKQTVSDVNALFVADDVLTWLENGADNVDIWAAHNSPFDGNLSSSLDGTANYGDFGIVSVGQTTPAGAVEPPAGTAFPTYYGLQMLHLMGVNYNNMLFPETSSTTMIAAHATYNFPWYMDAAGNVFMGDQANVLLINKDPTNAYNVTVSLYDATGTANIYTYGRDYSNGQNGQATMTSISQSTQSLSGSSYTVTINPHTMVLINMPAGGWSQL